MSATLVLEGVLPSWAAPDAKQPALDAQARAELMPVANRLLHAPGPIPTEEVIPVVDELISLSERNENFAQVADSAHVYSIWLLARWFTEHASIACHEAHVLFARAVANIADHERRGIPVNWRPGVPPDPKTFGTTWDIDFARKVWKCARLPGALLYYGELAYFQTKTTGSWRPFVLHAYELEDVAHADTTVWAAWYRAKAEEAKRQLRYPYHSRWQARIHQALSRYFQHHGRFPALDNNAAFADLMKELEPFQQDVAPAEEWTEAALLFGLDDYSPAIGIARFTLRDPREGGAR
jgi:hypothetical protein